MRQCGFLTAILFGLFAVCFCTDEVFARCRCDGAGGSRRQARHEKRATRRSTQAAAVNTPQGYYNPYGGDSITPLGIQSAGIQSATDTELQWRCGPRGCYPIRVKVSPSKVAPTPDPRFQPAPRPEDAKAPEPPPLSPPAVDPLPAGAVIPPGVVNP